MRGRKFQGRKLYAEIQYSAQQFQSAGRYKRGQILKKTALWNTMKYSNFHEPPFSQCMYLCYYDV